MIETALDIIKTELQSIGVPYEFMQWTSDVQYPYWVGEYTETPTDTEDGYHEGTLLLTGTTRKSWLGLAEHRAKIEDHFPSVSGLRKTTGKGAVVIFYANSMPVDTGEAESKRMQINLQIKAWKGIN